MEYPMLRNWRDIPFDRMSQDAPAAISVARAAMESRNLDPGNSVHLFFFLYGANWVYRIRVQNQVKDLVAAYPGRRPASLRRSAGRSLMALTESLAYALTFIRAAPLGCQEAALGGKYVQTYDSRVIPPDWWARLGTPISDTWRCFADQAEQRPALLREESRRQALMVADADIRGSSTASRQCGAYGMINGADYLTQRAITQAMLPDFAADLLNGARRRLILDLDGYLPTAVMRYAAAPPPSFLQRCN
jgi:hypothetical protein